jgi:signal peptidase II
MLLVAGIALVTFALDRFTKSWVEQNIELYGSRQVVGEYVRIVHTENTGAAFGLLPERTTLLSILSVFAVIAILYYYRQIASHSPLIAGTLGMQLGGAFGNLYDRAIDHRVIDFIDVGIPGGWRFWAFNVADSSIVVGISVVMFLLWLEERKATPRPA